MKRRIYPTCLLMIFLMSNAYSRGPATSGNYLAGAKGTPVEADSPKRIPSENDAGFLDYLPVWTTSHCQNQDHPQLTVQNLTFINGNSKGEEVYDGGGAIFFVSHDRTGKNVTGFPGKAVHNGFISVQPIRSQSLTRNNRLRPWNCFQFRISPFGSEGSIPSGV
jgi:hypothetical protein